LHCSWEDRLDIISPYPKNPFKRLEISVSVNGAGHRGQSEGIRPDPL
jgi:ribosomal protein S9